MRWVVRCMWLVLPEKTSPRTRCAVPGLPDLVPVVVGDGERAELLLVPGDEGLFFIAGPALDLILAEAGLGDGRVLLQEEQLLRPSLCQGLQLVDIPIDQCELLRP